MSDCVRAIRSAVGDDVISETEAAALLTRMKNIAEARKASKFIDMEVALKEVAGELKAGTDSLQQISTRNKLLSLTAFKRQVETVMKSDGVKAKVLRKQLEKTWDVANALEKRFVGPLAAKVKELGLDKEFRAQKYSKEAFIESRNVGTGGTSPIVPGEIGKKLFELMKFHHEARHQRNAMVNMRGGYYPEHADYTFMQSHSTERLRQMGGKRDNDNKSRARSAFFDLVARVNIDPRTYEGRDPSLFWSNVFDNIYNDSHLETPKQIDVDKFSGVHGSLANKLSAQRLIWFADAESQWTWNNAIGSADWAELMIRENTSAAKSIALMNDWGPNWQDNIGKISEHLQAAAQDAQDSAKQMKGFKGENLPAYVRIISGEADVPTRPTVATWVKNAIQFLHLSKMGGATIASFGDVVQVNNQMAINGLKPIERIGAQLDLVTDPKILHGLNVVSSSFLGSLHNRFGIGEATGAMSRASHAMFQLNFFNRWNDMNTETMAKTLSWWMGEHSGKGFDALPDGLREQLSKADIRAADWDAIRSTASGLDQSDISPEAKKYVLLDKLEDLTDDMVDRVITERGLKVTPANRKRVRQDIDIRLSTYFSQQVNAALNTPDLRTKYITTFGGAQAGTLPRAVADLAMVFKSFPISVALRMKRRIEDAGITANPMAWQEKQWSFAWKQAQLIAWTGVAGYVAMTTRDLLNGRTRRKLFDEDGSPNSSVWIAALSKGGGLGIMGDFLFSEYDRQYKSALNTFAGPAFGLVDPLGAAYTTARRTALGEDVKEKASGELFNLAANNLPFANLFYIKPILNAFVFYNIREALSPGVLRRAEKTARDMNYQDFWIEPSELADIPVTEPGRKIEALIP